MPDDRGDAPLVPLLVDGSGRDGTTLMMQLLGTAAEIAFDRTYPYEQRYFSYLLHWSRLPTKEEWDPGSWNLDSISQTAAAAESEVVGPVPWAERSLLEGEDEREFWQDAFDATWAIFSRRAREAARARLGDASLDVRYYAQKNAGSWAMPLESLPQVRLVCVLRDPRDTWMSSLAFHRRREAAGEAFLPIGPGMSEEEALSQFIEDQQARLRWLRTVESAHEAPLVRYESLVGDLETEAGRLGEWLGVRLDAEAVLRRRGDFEKHITAGGAEQSVGRWRQEMSADLAARFWQAMGEELAGFGFEP